MTHSAAQVDLETYELQGYLVEPACLDAGEVSGCLRRIDALVSELYGPVPLARTLWRKVGGGDGFAGLGDHPRLRPLVEALLGGASRLCECRVLLRPPHVADAERWRQEGARFSPRPSRMVCVQIALDDAIEENGCMVVLRRSHRDGYAAHVWLNGQWLADATRPSLGSLSDPGRPVLLPAGGAIFFDGLLFHGAVPNTGAEWRRAVQLAFVPAGEECLPSE
ncbi:MAG: phytanoyl-CoA dioxygenase family protein [Armatimonadetes bacterium]|nr:phytanoyl-CoA dioxygenase family protein [Armatimonadota bacterium]